MVLMTGELADPHKKVLQERDVLHGTSPSPLLLVAHVMCSHFLHWKLRFTLSDSFF